MERIVIKPEGGDKPEIKPIEPAQTAKPDNNIVSPEDALKAADNANVPIISQETITPGSPNQQITPARASVSAGNLIDGKLAIDLVDSVLPSLLVLLFHSVGMKMKKTDLQLTEREKGTLAPLLQKCLDSMLINFNNPWTALGISAGIIYGSKILEKGGVAMLDSKMKQKETVKVEEAKAAQSAANVTPAEKENANKSPVEIVKAITGNTVSFSEGGIKAFMYDKKVSYEMALLKMKAQYAKGKLLQKYR